MNNKFPFYIPTKGRSEYMLTSKALTKMGISHFLVVEDSQVEDYERSIQENELLAEVLVLDPSFKKSYELCDDLGLSKSTGPGPARNFAWEHSINNGHDWHWVMDDNIRYFCRLYRKFRIRSNASSFFSPMEDFSMRYRNVAMSGPNYTMFAIPRPRLPPFLTNTRIYSCNLIRNNLDFRWRGRYNEDTILSLDLLKAGYCTILFYAFLQKKIVTQQQKGGNTEEFYKREGTLAKSKMLIKAYPDLSRLVIRYGRVHHHVDYSVFKHQLIRDKSIEVHKGTDNYGVSLVNKSNIQI